MPLRASHAVLLPMGGQICAPRAHSAQPRMSNDLQRKSAELLKEYTNLCVIRVIRQEGASHATTSRCDAPRRAAKRRARPWRDLPNLARPPAKFSAMPTHVYTVIRQHEAGDADSAHSPTPERPPKPSYAQLRPIALGPSPCDAKSPETSTSPTQISPQGKPKELLPKMGFCERAFFVYITIFS